MIQGLLSTKLLLSTFLLVIPQILVVLPWLFLLDPGLFRKRSNLWSMLGVFVAIWFGTTIFVDKVGLSPNAIRYGKIYGMIFHVQLLTTLLILIPQLLTYLLPKTGAVALAAYRESWRQPIFWVITIMGMLAILSSVFIPYFTFGDDFKMMKQIGYDIVMLTAVMFGVLTAALSISEEIEGRTAITVMSKPINRRQFLIGKFLGILLACFAMTMLLAIVLNLALWAMPEFDPINKDRAFDPMPEEAKSWLQSNMAVKIPAEQARRFGEGSLMWCGEVFANFFGLMLGFGRVMILTAIATALATRVPFVVNVVITSAVYFLGNLAAKIVAVSENAQAEDGSAGLGLVTFLGKTNNVILPDLTVFSNNTVIIRDAPLELSPFILYTLIVLGYGVVYTTIALIVGLLLFENRDLA